MADYPRVSAIIRAHVMPETSPYFHPKYQRRGRLTEAACNLVLLGRDSMLEDWYHGFSESPVDPTDHIEHEEIRPRVEKFRRWLADTRAEVMHIDGEPLIQVEVISHTEFFMGHLDFVLTFPSDANWWIVDLKCGEAEDWHRAQTALYYIGFLATKSLRYAATIKCLGRMKRGALYIPSEGKAHFERHEHHDDIGHAHALVAGYNAAGYFRRKPL